MIINLGIIMDSASLQGDWELYNIPIELIEKMLEGDEIDIGDLYSFGSTCTKYYDLVFKYGNCIWKAKFKQVWPHFFKHECYKDHVVSDWHEEVRQKWIVTTQTNKLVSGLSALHIKHEELSSSDFKRFDQLIEETSHPLTLHFMIDALMLCIHHPNKNTNLTNKYYSEKALRYLRQIEVTQKWEKYKNLPVEEQLLEAGAVIVAQWSKPTENITNEVIGKLFDEIAEEVRKKLLLEHGEKHPALCVPNELRMRWRTHNIEDNYYTTHVSRQVIVAVAKVLYGDMGFRGNSDLYYSYENSCINKVLENRKGIPITLAVVHESVARRLGVKCEPVSFPGHFLLRWRDTYKENTPTQCFYIDVFNGGVFLGKQSCPQFAQNASGRCPMGDVFRFGPAKAVEVVQRMANNLEMAGRQRLSMNGRTARLRSALELVYLVNPNNVNCLVQLARFYMQYNMEVTALRTALEQDMQTRFNLRDLGQAAHTLRSLIDYDDIYLANREGSEPEGLEVKKRDGVQVQYSVGLVMRHRRYHYTCVIIGWDPTCVASEEWITQMNVKQLSRQHMQPFYHVLVSDGTNRYAAEENLELEQAENTWVTHCEVGRYFKEFCGTHYLLNEQVLLAYPQDPAFTAKLLNPE